MEYYLNLVDTSDLKEKVEWILANPKECEQNSIQMQIMNLIKNIHQRLIIDN